MPIARADRLTHVSTAPAPPGVPYPGEIEGLRAQQRLRDRIEIEGAAWQKLRAGEGIPARHRPRSGVTEGRTA
ncbi:hypothetical protein WI560_28395 [Bradyrhizobium sp. A11]|uniref:hypothetical protein n=1 Tax=Bradyrhizobium sp. A11 TaxID=3133974 RepID=UPI0032442FC9